MFDKNLAWPLVDGSKFDRQQQGVLPGIWSQLDDTPFELGVPSGIWPGCHCSCLLVFLTVRCTGEDGWMMEKQCKDVDEDYVCKGN